VSANRRQLSDATSDDCRQNEGEALSATSAPAPRRSLVWVEVDGELVVADEESGGLHLLNPTAALVFSCLDGASTLEEIAGDIAAELGSDPAQVTADVVALARQLQAMGVLAEEDDR
jgi:hypothetical protein